MPATCYLYAQIGAEGFGGLNILGAGCFSSDDFTRMWDRRTWLVQVMSAQGVTYEDACKQVFLNLAQEVKYRTIPEWAGEKLLHLLADRGRSDEREYARAALESVRRYRDSGQP